MTEQSKTVRLRIGKWYAKNLLHIDAGFNAEFSKWNVEGNECTVTFTCFDDYPDSRFRRTKEDLEEWVIKRFGSMILEDKRKPRSLDLSAAAKGLPLTHPIVKKDRKDFPSLQTNFDEEYYLPLTKEQLIEANSTLAASTGTRIKPDNVKKTYGYESDVYNLRMGTWR